MSYDNCLRASIRYTQFVQETNSTNYYFSILTHYKTWEISKRFSDFAALHKTLIEKKEFDNLPELPPKRWFGKNSEATINERTRGFENYLNQLLSFPGSLLSSDIVNFIQIEEEVVRLLLNHQSFLKKTISESLKSSFLGESCKSSGSLQDSNSNISDNFYRNLFIFSQNQPRGENRNLQFEGNKLVVEEFLRNLSTQKDYQSSIIKSFEEFYQNQMKKEIFFTRTDIELLFIGSDAYNKNFEYDFSMEKKNKNIKENFLQGLLFHIGNIKDNLIGAEACLTFLLKLLSYEFNLDSEKYIYILKSIDRKYLAMIKLNEIIKFYKKESFIQAGFNLIIILYNNQFELEKLFSFSDYEFISQEISKRL